MSTDTIAAGSPALVPDGQRLDAVLQKVLPFASMADALARRSVGKIRTLALLGLLAALWIAYACALTFGSGLATSAIVLLVVMLPAAVLWKIHGALRSAVGLPQRLVDTATRLAGTAGEYKRLYERRGALPPSQARPRFRQLWNAGNSLLELKALSNETQEILAAAGGAVILANPLFATALAGTIAATLLIIGLAALSMLALLL